jgi:hypothetical protein
MDAFETIISISFTDSELIETINAAVAGATEDVLSAMPADAWR